LDLRSRVVQMNWKSTAAGTAATALVAWLAAPASPPAGSVATPPAAPSRELPELPNLDVEATRLAAQRELLVAATAPASRDPFRFSARPAPRVRPAPAVVEAPALVVRRSLSVRLAGIATDVVSGAPERTAIFTGQAGVVLAKVGDVVDGFRVTDVTDRDVSLVSLDDQHVERVPLPR
jgi:hypothetical protein